MRHDYAKSLRKFDFYIPIPEVRSVEKDSESFLEALASYWDGYFALKRTLNAFSVLNFFTKNAKFVFRFGRSFKVFCIRVAFCLCMGMF